MSAMATTIIAAAGFDAVADNFAAAMLAFRSQGVNGAFEAIEIVRNTCDDNLDRFVIFISANFTWAHIIPFFFAGWKRHLNRRFALETFTSGADHLVLLGILNALLNQLLREGLLVRGGHSRRALAFAFRHGFPALIFSKLLGLGLLWRQAFLP